MVSDEYIYSRVKTHMYGSEHPDLQVYRRTFISQTQFETKWRNWIANLRRTCKIGGFYNAQILEVGCGFGWDSVAISLIGDSRVVASDILPSMIDGLTECLDAGKRSGFPLNITPMVGDNLHDAT
jgi:SAM-dependent methyltransferase